MLTQALAARLRGDRDRVAAVRRVESAAVGSRALERLAQLAARLLDAGSAQVSLLGEQQTVAGGSGLAPDAVGGQGPLADSLCTVTASGPGPLVVTDAAADDRVAHLPPVRAGAVGSYLGMPLTGSGGHVVGALCVFDPAPREWSEADLVLIGQLADSVATELELSALSTEFEASRLRWGLAIDAAEIGSFDWDLLTGRLVWDDRLVELFGYERHSFGETIEDFNARLHPDDVPRVADALEASIASVGLFEAEYRVQLPTGETRWVLGRGRALADDSGRAVRLLGAAYDTTRQRHGDARVARVLESMSAAFYSVDREWRFTYVNSEAERLLQQSRDGLLGGVIWELFPATVGSDFETVYRGAVSSGAQAVFEAYYPPPLDGWYEIRVWPSPDGLSVYFLDITERRAAEERARRSAARLALIAEVTAVFGAALAGDRTSEDALDALAGTVVPVLGDAAIVSRLDADGRMRDVSSAHVDPELAPVLARYAALRLPALQPTAPVVAALDSGHVAASDDLDAVVGAHLPAGEVADCYARLGLRSVAAFPLVARGRTVGALTVYRGSARPAPDEEDLSAGREVADRAALAMDAVRLYEQQRRIAEELQRSLLTAPPATPGARVAVRYLPAAEAAQVGGDWYDAFHQPGGGLVLVIGDVVGHDTEAAAAMGQLRGLLRGIAFRQGWGPRDVLVDLDRAIQGLQVDTMGTAAIARLEPADPDAPAGSTRVRWSNAGHPPLMVLRADGGVDELSVARADLMLGVDDSLPRREHEVLVGPGSTVLLYTDGLVEGRDMPLDEGLTRLHRVLRELGPVAPGEQALEEFCDRVVEQLRPSGSEDDVALLAVRLD
ncbi:SpoIIE family protein phosphatase [Modestobacter sp. Leaf380]|uniref:SpoIIE family protein phosphatase n=1 Tax=Modestobacter sp. Leaf380 TaxID=1736356 RepID=UPI000ADE2F3E|nr:SpoIIE family protein phosphatase [Modestobacter sp. Leaf380]